MFQKIAFAKPQACRCDLKQFIAVDIGHHILERHPARRHKRHCLVRAGSPDVGQFLALQNIYLEIIVTAVLADDHALIDRGLRIDEHYPAILQVEKRIGDSGAGFRGDQRAIAAARYITTIGLVAMEHTVQNAGATGVGQKPAGIANQAA